MRYAPTHAHLAVPREGHRANLGTVVGAQESVEAAVGDGVPELHAAVRAAAREVLAVRREPERRGVLLSNAQRFGWNRDAVSNPSTTA